MRRAIADATPLIYLAAIDRFPLLEASFDHVLVPAAVWREVVQEGESEGEGKVGAREVVEAEQAGWVENVGPVATRELGSQADRLESGESQAIGLALERPGAVLLIDEHAGREVADDLDVDYTGTIGLLLRAKKEGRIPAVRPVLERLQQEAGFWLDDELENQILQAAGEDP